MLAALRSQRPMLESLDLKATIEFYTEKLGFAAPYTWEHEGTLQWVSLVKDNVTIMFTSPNANTHTKSPTLTGSIYYNTDDIESLWLAVKNDCEIVYPIQDFTYGMREFAIKDNNGYVLNFGMPVQPETDYDKLFPLDIKLETSRVLLRALKKTDAEEMFSLTQADDIWKFFPKQLNDEKNFQSFIKDAVSDRLNGKRVPFTIIEKGTGNICGSTSYLNLSIYDKRLEIGFTWLGEKYIGAGINRHAKFALLRYAFEEIGFERVEFKTDNLNERSKAALRKIGCTEEGIFRNHMQMPNNRRRWSAYFSIIKEEWPELKERIFGDIA